MAGAGGAASGAGGGVTGAGGVGGAGGALQACTNLAPTGPAVVETAGSGSAPAAAGGTIAGGTYQLTAWAVYSPATPDVTRSRNLAMRFSGSNFEVAGTDSSTDAVNYTASWTTTNKTLTTTWTCGPTGSVQQGYTASSTQLLILSPRSGGVEVETWTLQ